MISKSLPAVLQQALEYHVNESQLTHDDELQGIYDRLSNLNEKVEFLKNKIKNNREKKTLTYKVSI
jgi:tetrahydromethanopterin S-methyltransferase subunit G